MDIKKPPENKVIIDKVEEALQAAYDSNKDFNDALDSLDLITITGVKDEPYLYRRSEILYWVDRKAYFDELDHWDGRREEEIHQSAREFIKSSDQEGLFRDLVDAIRLGRIAPFVGAGISQACDYPLWSEALKKMATRLEGLNEDIATLIDKYDYLEIAQILHDVSAEQVNHFIKTEFRQRSAAIKGPALLLPELSKGCIVTTNFDTVIEDIFAQRQQPLDGYMYGMQPGNNFVQRLLRGERCILKLHGDARQEKTYVFTERQYAQAYGEILSFQNQLPRALRQIFISNSLLFLGCSLAQDRTLELFKSVVDEASFDIPDHYAFLSNPGNRQEKAKKEERLLKLKIRPIWYDVADNDHSLLEQILKMAISEAKRQSGFQ